MAFLDRRYWQSSMESSIRKEISVFKFQSGKLRLEDIQKLLLGDYAFLSAIEQNICSQGNSHSFQLSPFSVSNNLINYYFLIVCTWAVFLLKSNASRVVDVDIIVEPRFRFFAISRKPVAGCSLMRQSQSSLNHCFPFPLFANSAEIFMKSARK